MQMDKFLKEISLTETAEQAGGSDKPNHVCEHVERLETLYDDDGNEIEVKTDFQIQEWKHACRSCRDMESLVTQQKQPPGQRRKLSTPS
jgi:hypothetical protein